MFNQNMQQHRSEDTAGLSQRTAEMPSQSHHPSKQRSQAVSPSLLPPCHAAGSWEILCVRPIGQVPPWRMSFAHLKNLHCPSLWSTTSIQVCHANYTSDRWKLVLLAVSPVSPDLQEHLSTPEAHNMVKGVVASSSWYQSTWDCAQEHSFSTQTYEALQPYWNGQGEILLQDSSDSTYPSREHSYLLFKVYF